MRFLTLMMLMLSGWVMQAQSGTWKFGFELGWSNSKIQGDVETSAAGTELETQEFNTGFHLSFYGRRHFTDLFGLQIGIAYAQRGTRNQFDGNSYYLFGKNGSQVRLTDVVRSENQDILNGYLDFPVVAFHKIGKHFEVGAGMYGSIMVASKSDGSIRLSDNGNRFETFFINTEKKYLRDNFGDIPSGAQIIEFSGTTYEEPVTISSYYELLEDPGSDLYNRIDYGLLAQLGFYFNESLNLKGRFSYGLADVTKMEADVSKSSSRASGLTFRDDKDRNLSMQISLGFLF